MATKKKANVALDVGSHTLKIMEVLPATKPPTITKIGVHDLPDASEENLIKGLKSLLVTTRVPAKEIATSVSGSGVVVRFIELPLLQEAELVQALPYEADKYIPFDISDVMLEHVILGRDEVKKKMKVLLVCARKDFINDRIEVFKKAGLRPYLIDVDSFTIFNSFIKSVSTEERGRKTIMLLNIGSRLTNVVVACGDTPWMIRDINMGGSNLTQALQEQLGVEKLRAETLKHDTAKRNEEMLGMLKGALLHLAEEIKISFTYYENQYGKGVDEVYISGGTSSLRGLDVILKESTGLEYRRWDPLSPFEVSADISRETLDRLRPSLVVCSGLALRGNNR